MPDIHLLQLPPAKEANVELLTGALRVGNESLNFTSRDHPVPYRISVVDEQHQVIKELPVTEEWPPDSAPMIERLQQASHDPQAAPQELHLTIGNHGDPRRAYVWALPMFTLTPGGTKVSLPEPRYFVGLGQFISTVRYDTLSETPSLLMPKFTASTTDPLHAAWTGGKRVPVPDREEDLIKCWYDHLPLPMGTTVDATGLIRILWDKIDEAAHQQFDEDYITEFHVAIMTGPPDPIGTVPKYPEMPIPPEVLEVQRISITQLELNSPTAELLTEVTLARGMALADTAKLIAGALPEVAPYAFDSLAELEEATAQQRRQ